MKKSIFILVSLLIFSSCAHKVKIMHASAVSMSRKHGVKAKAMDKGEVTGKSCYEATGASKGLMDEAIKDAQKSSKADYIADATFYASGQCVTVEGTAMRYKRR